MAGCVHDNYVQKEHDYYRDLLLNRHGIEVHRYSNDDVLYRPQETAYKVYSTLKYKNDHLEIGVMEHEGCFIATAAYGTTTAKELDVIRKFRDVKLKTNPVGRRITGLYYLISPPIANIIARSNEIRCFVRKCLSPIISFLKRKGY